MKIHALSILYLLSATALHAQSFDKEAYYSSADGAKGRTLKTRLADIISNHKVHSYDALWEDFMTTDAREDGSVWDMYSCVTDYTFGKDRAGSYKGEGDCYNREHSFPKSWFDDGKPMYTDLYHLYPTDGYVNGRRSNYCYGNVASATYATAQGFCRLGHPTTDLKNNGCKEDLVFEPNDLYKGDLARTYFYMVTAYEDRLSNWSGSGMLSKNAYPAFTNWAIKLLLDWSKNDEISKKETDRIEAVYAIQENRNPFIDFPGLELYIWGDWQDSTFHVSNYRNPYTAKTNGDGSTTGGQTGNDETGNGGNGDSGNSGGDSGTTTVVPTYDNYYEKVTTDLEDWSGQYLVVYEKNADEAYVFDGSLTSLDVASNYITATISEGKIEATEQAVASSFTISAVDGGYTMQSASGFYIGRVSSNNGFNISATEKYVNTLSAKTGIKGEVSYYLHFNSTSSQMRFRFYSLTSQQPISLYRRVEKEPTPDTESTHIQTSIVNEGDVYHDLYGRVYLRLPSRPGVYIHNRKKIIVK